MVSSIQAEPARRRRRQDSGGLVQGFVDATAARIRRDAAAGRTSLETLFTIWMRTLYSPDPEPSAG
jgi:hypothetical protein